MFCSKCGHEVDDDDEFCRHCGAPIHKKQETHITSTGKLPLNDHKAESGESLSFLQSWTISKKLLVYTIVTLLLMTMLCIIALPPGVSVTEFMTSPHGFTAVFGTVLGMSLVPFLLFLPLIGGLHKLGVTKKPYRIEVFYLILIVNTLGFISVGRTAWPRQYLPPIMIVGFVVGVITYLVGRHKNR